MKEDAPMNVIHLPAARRDEVVNVLESGFRDYPVMHYVLGSGPDYDARLRTLLGFFVTARHLRAEPVLGVHSGRQLVGVALVTLPGARPSPQELDFHRKALWTGLGSEARARYEAYSAAAGRHEVPPHHHHLNMIAVLPWHTGRGFARRLLDAVHELAERDPASTGVSLCTESESNVSLYEHVGYSVLGRSRVSDNLQTWAMFRPVTASRGG
jgi:ribosomal protein S18 acetylase RimI-like enzyme